MFFVGLLPALADTTAYLSPKTLLCFPLSINTLFSIRLLSTCMAPFSWLVLLAWLLLAGPLSRSQHPARGSLALALLVLMSDFLGFTLANTAVLPALRVRFFAAAGALLFLAIYLFSSGGNVFGLMALLPPGLVERTAMGRDPWLPLPLLAIISFVTLLLARQTFVLTLCSSEQIARQSRPNRVLKLLWWTAPMFVKEIRYCRYVLDLYISLFIVIGLIFYLGLIKTAAPEAVAVSESMIVLFSVSLAANSFGLDGAPGVDRYGLFPISGEHIMKVKNAAFLTIVSVLLLAVMPFAAWRLGPVIASIVFIQAMAGAILCMCWGNLLPSDGLRP